MNTIRDEKPRMMRGFDGESRSRETIAGRLVDDVRVPEFWCNGKPEGPTSRRD